MDYKIFLYILFGILPSMAWLFYYLRKDSHPEPKGMIIKIFLWGALITIPVFFIQIGMRRILDGFELSSFTYSLIYWFLIISLTEEIFKYLVIRLRVVGSPHLDEPVDFMIYMIVAALGFAAVENVLYLFAPIEGLAFNTIVNRAVVVSIIRFIGATFLHTLCSAVIGYAIAISYCDMKNKFLEIGLGIFTAVLLHGLYDFSIMTLDGYLKLAIPVATIIVLVFIVLYAFEKLKKMRGMCRIN